MLFHVALLLNDLPDQYCILGRIDPISKHLHNMKTSLRLFSGLLLASTLLPVATADLLWDFTQGGTEGWGHYRLDYIEQPAGEEPLFGPFAVGGGGEDEDVISIAKTFKPLTGEDYGVENSNGALVANGGMAGITSLGDLSSYAGGSFEFIYNEYKTTRWGNENGTPPSNTNAYIFLTGMVGGEAVMLRHQLVYSFDSDQTQQYNLQLDSSNFEKAEYKKVYSGFNDTFSVDTFGSLDEAAFQEFLANVDGLYFRMAADVPTYVGAPEERDNWWVTRLSSVSLSGLGQIPEPGTAVLLAPALCFFLRRRRS